MFGEKLTFLKTQEEKLVDIEKLQYNEICNKMRDFVNEANDVSLAFWTQMFPQISILRKIQSGFQPPHILALSASAENTSYDVEKKQIVINYLSIIDKVDKKNWQYAREVISAVLFHEMTHYIVSVMNMPGYCKAMTYMRDSIELSSVGSKFGGTNEDVADYLSGVMLAYMLARKNESYQIGAKDAVSDFYLIVGSEIISRSNNFLARAQKYGMSWEKCFSCAYKPNMTADERWRSHDGHGVSFVRSRSFESGFYDGKKDSIGAVEKSLFMINDALSKILTEIDIKRR